MAGVAVVHQRLVGGGQRVGQHRDARRRGRAAPASVAARVARRGRSRARRSARCERAERSRATCASATGRRRRRRRPAFCGASAITSAPAGSSSTRPASSCGLDRLGGRAVAAAHRRRRRRRPGGRRPRATAAPDQAARPGTRPREFQKRSNTAASSATTGPLDSRSMSMKFASPPRSKYSSAMLRPPVTAKLPSAMNSLLCMRWLMRENWCSEQHDALREAAAAHRQRVEQADLDVVVRGQAGEQLVLAGGVQVVDQDADAHAARGGGAAARAGTRGRWRRWRSGSTGRRASSRRGGSGRCGRRTPRRRRPAGESRRARRAPRRSSRRRRSAPGRCRRRRCAANDTGRSTWLGRAAQPPSATATVSRTARQAQAERRRAADRHRGPGQGPAGGGELREGHGAGHGESRGRRRSGQIEVRVDRRPPRRWRRRR